jgi:hypothetical protein
VNIGIHSFVTAFLIFTYFLTLVIWVYDKRKANGSGTFCLGAYDQYYPLRIYTTYSSLNAMFFRVKPEIQQPLCILDYFQWILNRPRQRR